MIPPLLTSKLSIPPLHRDHIHRPNLTAKLQSEQNHKLTLVCTPAGFGKSSLLSEWASQSAALIAWLSLDVNDNVPTRFLQYLAAACQYGLNGLMDNAQFEANAVDANSVQAELTTFIYSLAAIEEPFGIILDNYQMIEEQVIHDGVTLLLNHLPPQVHLFIASRSEPPLPLARFRTRDQMTELRVDDLRFTYPESLKFFKRSNTESLSKEQVASLHERTEGWIEGLRAAEISLRDSDQDQQANYITEFSGCDRTIADYLMEEIFLPQSDELQTFLLQTSILDHFNSSLCRAVTGQNQTQQFLEKLERYNLFIEAVDTFRNRYRYHQLFAELLRQRLQQFYPNEVSVLHQKASRWYEQHNLLNEAIQHALASRDWENALRLIDRFAVSMPSSKQFPATISSREQSAIPYWVHPDGYLNGIVQARPLLAPSVSTNIDDGGLETFDACQIHLRTGQVADAEQILSAIDLTHPDFIEPKAQFGLVSTLGEVRMIQGKLNLAAATYEPMMAQAAEEPLGPYLFNFYHGLYGLYYEWNQLEQAHQNLHAFLDRIKQDDEPSIWSVQGHVDLAWLLWATAQNQAADKTMAHAAEMVRGFNNPNYLRKVAVQQAKLGLKQNNIDAALHWYRSCGLHPNDDVVYANQDEYLTLARVLIHQEHSEQALPLLERLYTVAEESQRERDVVKILVLTALAYRAQGDHEQAFAALAEAVCLAEQNEYIRTFLDEGTPLAELLQQVSTHGIALLYTRKLLAAFGKSPQAPIERPALKGDKATAQTSLIEPLSQRELEVLRLIADGNLNREIAAQLTIAASTVKKHVGNILGKLSAKNRTQAVAKARIQGLL